MGELIWEDRYGTIDMGGLIWEEEMEVDHQNLSSSSAH